MSGETTVILDQLHKAAQNIAEVRIGFRGSALTTDIEGAIVWGGYIYKFDATPMVKHLRETGGRVEFGEFETWIKHKIYMLAKGIVDGGDPSEGEISKIITP